MPKIEALAKAIEVAHGYTSGIVESVDHSEWFRQPGEGLTHVAWQVGHMAVAQYSLTLRFVRGEQPGDSDFIPPEYFKLFGRGSQPEGDAGKYPSPAEIYAVFNNVYAEVMATIPSYSDELLAEPIIGSHPAFEFKEQTLRFCPMHETSHTGQISLLKRLFGHAPLR